MLENFNAAEMVDTYAVPWAINIAMALVILLLGRFAVAIVVRVAEAVMTRAKVDPMLVRFIASILTGLLVLMVVIAAVDQLGVDTTSFVALIGAAGLAIGLALQNSLGNFASGVMLILFKPFKVGDYVEAGSTAGVVKEIRIFSTIMTTPDNRRVIVPNGSIYENTIVNYSALDTRRLDLVFSIGYDDDLKLAKDILEKTLREDERVLAEPEPVVQLGELADNSVNFNVRPWVSQADYWALRSDLIEKVKLTFDANGITIPYPQRDVYVHQVAAR
ncbi:mechanosensitive ion channel family protein [Gilvimarinus sp. F26214L]|uniref:mechanosensitive ion channel family protein n=1 Tax=Gilvimarinus sp. DZF01 TaxID=3461371 RepID=UPI0040465BA4